MTCIFAKNNAMWYVVCPKTTLAGRSGTVFELTGLLFLFGSQLVVKLWTGSKFW